MIPVARTENLLVQEFEDEVIICEMGSNATHCLSPIATRVWKYCDGSNTVEDIAKFLEEDLDVSLDSDVDVRGLVWLMIDELQRNGLIKEYLKQPIIDSSISRRKMLKRLSIAGGFAAGAMFPAVRSMMMPEPAIAASPTPTPNCSASFRVSGQDYGASKFEAKRKAQSQANVKCICPPGCTAVYEEDSDSPSAIGPLNGQSDENSFFGGSTGICHCS